MQFLVCLLSTLFLNMRRNALLIAKLTNGKDERSFRPKLASPESFLHHWYASEYLSGYDTFDRLHNLLGTIHRYRLDQKMNVIPINPYFQKPNLISLRYFQTYVSKLVINFSVNTTRRYFAGHTKWYSRTDTLWLL